MAVRVLPLCFRQPFPDLLSGRPDRAVFYPCLFCDLRICKPLLDIGLNDILGFFWFRLLSTRFFRYPGFTMSLICWRDIRFRLPPWTLRSTFSS